MAWPNVPAFDELERPKSLPLATDCEKTSIAAELWDAKHERTTLFFFVISHRGDEVVHVEFPSDWRPLARAIGLDPDDGNADGWLAIEAARAFARKPR